MLQCRLCWNKEKCLKPGLKCVNRWSSSTVQGKIVPESWSSNRETTSSSVQVVRRNWQKLLSGRPQRARLTVWADQISKVAWLLKSGHLITKFSKFEINPPYGLPNTLLTRGAVREVLISCRGQQSLECESVDGISCSVSVIGITRWIAKCHKTAST